MKKKTSSKKKVSETQEQKAELLRFLKLAMQTEREGIKFYISVKKQIDDYNMDRLMDVILDQEKEHLKIVTEMYNAEKKKGIEEAAKKASSYHKQEPLKTPLDSMNHLDEMVKKKTTIYHLFQKAVEFEEGISRIYLDMAKTAKHLKVKKLLKTLSDEEIAHKHFIQMHQDSIYNTGYWFGMEHVRLET